MIRESCILGSHPFILDICNLDTLFFLNGSNTSLSRAIFIGTTFLDPHVVCSRFLFMHRDPYYWIHRWMYKPGMYTSGFTAPIAKAFRVTTPGWTSFSFHPLESLLQALPLFLIIYFAFANRDGHFGFNHYGADQRVNHLNSELYPESTYRSRLGSW